MLHSIKGFKRRVSAIAIAVAAATGAYAADETGMWYVNPTAGYTLLDNARNVDDDFHVAGGFGVHATEHFSLEFNGLFGDFEGEAGSTLHQSAYSVDGLLVFGRANSVSPYLTFGGGYLSNNFNGPSNWGGPMAQAGLGLLMDIGDNSSSGFLFQFRPEVKYRMDWPDSPHASDDAGDIVVNLGFAFNFGGRRPAPVPVAQTPPPRLRHRHRRHPRRRWIRTATAYPTRPIAAPEPREAWRSMTSVARSSR